jgi:hypothetical protein
MMRPWRSSKGVLERTKEGDGRAAGERELYRR